MDTAASSLGQTVADTLKPLRSAYTLGSLLFTLTAARHPTFATYERRRRSLRTAAPRLDETAQSAWSNAGFFLDPRNEAMMCFHCGCRVPLSTSVGISTSPLRLHEQMAGQCELLRLLRVADGELSERDEQVTLSAARLKRALAKLSDDLRQRERLLRFVESFGFSWSDVLFCACRLFMTRGGCLPESAGDLVGQLQDCEQALQGDFGLVLDVEAVLAECAAMGQGATASSGQPRASQSNQATAAAAAASTTISHTASKKPPTGAGALASQMSVEEDEEDDNIEDVQDESSTKTQELDDDKCVQCRDRTRDRVTLPCAHFLLCQDCLAGRRNCPKCSAGILGIVRAFIA